MHVHAARLIADDLHLPQLLAGLAFAAGATLVLVALALSGSGDPVAIVAISLVAYLLGGVLIARHARLTTGSLELIMAAATVLITLAIVFGGAAGWAYEVLYVLVGAYAVAILPLRRAAAQIAFVLLAHAGVLLSDPPGGAWEDALARWLLVGGSAVLASVLTATLASALADGRERYRTGFERVGTPMALIGPDGRLEVVNCAACALLGRPRDELVGVSAVQFVHPDDRARTAAALARALSSATEAHVNLDLRVLRRGRGCVHVHVIAVATRGGEGGPQRLFALAWNVTAQKAAEASLAARAARHAGLADLGRRALAGDDLPAVLEAGARLVADTVSPLSAVLELEPGGAWLRLAAGTGWRSGLVERSRLPVDGGPNLGRVLATASPVLLEPGAVSASPLLRRHAAKSGVGVRIGAEEDGEPYGVLAAFAGVPDVFDGDDLHFLQSVAAVLTSAVRQHRERREADGKVLTDPVTGLASGALVRDRTEWALGATGAGGRTAVLLANLDHFARVTDSLGPGAGDQLLAAVGDRLRSAARVGDTLGRLAGDEFVLVAQDVRTDRVVLERAEAILDALSAPLQIAGEELYVSASVGIAFARPGDDVETVLRNADAAVHRAKERGRARYELFDEVLRRRLRDQLRFEASLRRAVRHGEMSLAFQPIASVEDGRAVGAEALLRWRDGAGVEIPPSRFVPVAEEMGLIGELGGWALREACRTAARWPLGPRASRPLLTVNLSRRQLVEPGLVDQVREALETSGLPPWALLLEVTETTLVEDEALAVRVLTDLQATGVGVALDDFGLGYSSLRWLKDLPIDTVKLDRTFVQGIADEPGAAAIAHAVITLGHDLGMAVIAEGVEREEQLARLRALGCPRAQGFLFSPPVGPERVVELLAR